MNTVNPRFIEGAAIDRLTGGGRGISDIDQRDLARRGLMPSRQQLVNDQLNSSQSAAQSLRTQKLQNQSLEYQVKEQKEKYLSDLYNKAYPSANSGSPAVGLATAQSGTGGATPTNSNGLTNSKYRYVMDNQAARDSGAFIRALDDGDMNTAMDLLNKTPYSSINNAKGINVDTVDGKRTVNIYGDGDAVLKTMDFDQLRSQINNLNSYVDRVRITNNPGREAMLDSPDILAAAESARDMAIQDLTSRAEKSNGQWHISGQKVDINKEGQKAFDKVMQKYSEQLPKQIVTRDNNYYRTQSQSGLGFDTGSRAVDRNKTLGIYTPKGLPDIDKILGESVGGEKGEDGKSKPAPAAPWKKDTSSLRQRSAQTPPQPQKKQWNGVYAQRSAGLSQPQTTPQTTQQTNNAPPPPRQSVSQPANQSTPAQLSQLETQMLQRIQQWQQTTGRQATQQDVMQIWRNAGYLENPSANFLANFT